VVIIGRAFVVALLQGKRSAQLHSSVGEIIDKIEVKTREIVVGAGSWAVVRAIDGIFGVPVGQESTAVSPLFDEFVIVNAWGVRVRPNIDGY
jgi:hypothetical protein